MTYQIGLFGLIGLGDTDAQREARALNAQQGVNDVSVGPGFFDIPLDAALEVSGIPSTEAGRVPDAVRSQLEATGAEVIKVCWGGGSNCGGPATRGKVYVKWKPDRDYNAVTYADIARNLFMNAADGFSAGARIIMRRYRIMYASVWAPFRDDKFVYAVGEPIPAGAPQAARRTNVDQLPPPETPASDNTGVNITEVASNVSPVAWGALAVGGAVLIGGAGLYTYYHFKGRPKRNGRRRRRRRRTTR